MRAVFAAAALSLSVLVFFAASLSPAGALAAPPASPPPTATVEGRLSLPPSGYPRLVVAPTLPIPTPTPMPDAPPTVTPDWAPIPREDTGREPARDLGVTTIDIRPAAPATTVTLQARGRPCQSPLVSEYRTPVQFWEETEGLAKDVLLSRAAPGGSQAVLPGACPTETAAPTATPTATLGKPLSWYPRPARDTRFGMHWSARQIDENYDPATVDAFLAELDQMGMSWLKILSPAGGPAPRHDYLLARARERGFEVVVRIYTEHNDPLAEDALRQIVSWYGARGVHYYELFNEPNLIGLPGGWWDANAIDEGKIALVTDRWLDAAEIVQAAGGIPLLTAMAPGGHFDDVYFEQRMLERLAQAPGGRGVALFRGGAGLAFHNYGFNHPVEYPEEKPLGSLKPGDDSNGFRKYEVYHELFRRIFGFEVPLIGTEGGWISNGQQLDRRFPVMDDALQARYTVESYRFLQEQAPAYVFTQMNWILTDGETPGWYRNRNPESRRPVVDALKEYVRARRLSEPR